MWRFYAVPLAHKILEKLTRLVTCKTKIKMNFLAGAFLALFDFRIGAFGLKRTGRTVLVRGTRGTRLNFSFWIMRGNHVAVQRRLFLGQLLYVGE